MRNYSIENSILIGVCLTLAFLLKFPSWQIMGIKNGAWWAINQGLANDELNRVVIGQKILADIYPDICALQTNYCLLLVEKLDETNHLTNGGFGFNEQSWIINSPREVNTEFSLVNPRIEDRALKLAFHGPDINFYHIYQEVTVESDVCYRLTAQIQTEALTGEVGLDIWDAERGYRYWYGGQTQLVGGSTKWTPVNLSFCTPQDVSRIQIRLRRFGGYGDGITGIAWFDNIRLENEN